MPDMRRQAPSELVMSMLRIVFSATVTLVTGLAMSWPAQAASEAAREHAARKACLTGNYKKGVEILSDLFLKTEDPVFLFNQGRCFEQNGRFEEALNRFREYLRKAEKASAKDKADAEKHIADCQVLLGQKPAAAAVEPSHEEPKAALTAPPSSPAAPVSNHQPTASPPAVASVPTGLGTEAAPSAPPTASDSLRVGLTVPPKLTAAQPSSAGSGLRIAGISTLAVGVAGIATGLVLNLKANSAASDIENQRPYQRSQETTRASYETWSQIGYGVGGACLAGGAILYYLGYAQGRASQVALVPSVGVGAYAAALQGVF
jgi:hypothetical protein